MARKLLTSLVASMLLVLSAPAWATTESYSGGQVTETTLIGAGNGGPNPEALPATGAEIGPLILGAAILVIAGLVVVWATRKARARS